MAAACLAYPAVSEVGTLLYGLRVLQAVAFAMVFAAGGALAVDLAAPERLGQAIGVYGLSFLSMNALAPAAVEQLALHAGFSTAFATSALGALACAGLSLRVPDPRAAGEADAARGLLRLLRRPALLLALVVIMLVGSALSAVFNFHQLFAVELGIERVSGFFVAYALAAIGVRLGFGLWMDRFGNARAAAIALVFYAGVVYAASHLGRVGLLPLGVGLGVAHGVFYPAFNAVVVSGARAAERGRVMAVFQAAFQTGMAGGGLAFGLLAARAGYPPVFEAAAAGLAVAFPLALAAAASRGPLLR
jgi:predicted MFS family arabinose efflux permease